jgi:hypothetical protein
MFWTRLIGFPSWHIKRFITQSASRGSMQDERISQFEMKLQG